jgi:hypothetical protein
MKTKCRGAQKGSLAKDFARNTCQKQRPRPSITKGAAVDALY